MPTIEETLYLPVRLMIECADISKIYASGDTETDALGGISFRIEEGEFVAIIGPSGSGKSMLMHIIKALDNPTSGKYLFENEDVSGFGDDELAELRNQKIGFVLQAFNLLLRATVIRNVTLPLLYDRINSRDREESAWRALIETGLDESNFHKRSNQLSDGQQQRVAIARAPATGGAAEKSAPLPPWRSQPDRAFPGARSFPII